MLIALLGAACLYQGIQIKELQEQTRIAEANYIMIDAQTAKNINRIWERQEQLWKAVWLDWGEENPAIALTWVHRANMDLIWEEVYGMRRSSGLVTDDTVSRIDSNEQTMSNERWISTDITERFFTWVFEFCTYNPDYLVCEDLPQ